MSKINKIITNYPVELTPEEVENLSLTLSAVRTAGGGGGGEGKIYHGEGFVTVNNTNNAISLTTEANEKLNQSIPTKVSDLTDSADYQTVAGMSDYSTKAVADTLYAPISVTGDVDTLKSSSGDWNKVSEKLDTTAFSTVSGNFLTEVPAGYATETWVENKHYLSAVPDTYYTKSQTSGADQLAAAFGNILDYDVTAAAGIEITTATDNGTTTFGISMTAEPVVTDTNLSGYNGIAAAPDGTKSGWWNVGLTQDMLNVINGKEDILSFSYDGDTITAINTSAVGKEFDGVVTAAGSLSGNGTTNSPLGLKTSAEQALAAVDGKVSKPTASQQQGVYVVWDKGPTQNWTDFYVAANSWANTFLFDSESPIVNGINGLSAGLVPGEFFDVYEVGIDTTNMTANKQYAFTTTGWMEVSAPTIPDITANNGLSANGHTIGIDNTNLVANTQYAWTTTGWDEISTPTIPAITAESGISADGYKIGLTESVYSAIQEISAANDLVGANGISVVTGLNNQIIIEPSGISPSKQYAMTTTGWAEVQAGTTFTGVTTAGSISGDGLTNPLGLKTSAENALTAVAEKLDITAASQTYLDKTTYATDSATFVTSSNSTITGTDKYALTTSGWANVETAYLPLTGGTVTGQMTLTGTSWDNRLTIGRSNTAIDIGVALNGALTLKANVNNACQFNMMQTGTSGVDINITYGQTPTAIGNLYVMKTHTTAEATTASGSWNGDNLLHIILDS